MMIERLKNIAISDYDYPLSDDKIARYPLSQRDHSKLLCYDRGAISEHHFYDIPALLPKDSILVFNDTRVVHARLLFRKPTGATIEVFCLEPYQDSIATAFERKRSVSWVCLVGNNKKWKGDTLSMPFQIGDKDFLLTVERGETLGDNHVIHFAWDGDISFAEVILRVGVVPLPPYMHRSATDEDNERYQTVYALNDGSVAAPTAGLHFTDKLLSQIQSRGIATEYVTLHVGAGTFKPVTTEHIGGHTMHVEQIVVSYSVLQDIIEHADKPLVAVGTTSVRTLESVYWFGVQLIKGEKIEQMSIEQWQPYQESVGDISRIDAYRSVLIWMKERGMTYLQGQTRLMIVPEYRYRVVDALVTNFHQPKSTLLLLVSALIGEDWKRCYDYALDHDFRFLSYGDSCFFIPRK